MRDASRPWSWTTDASLWRTRFAVKTASIPGKYLLCALWPTVFSWPLLLKLASRYSISLIYCSVSFVTFPFQEFLYYLQYIQELVFVAVCSPLPLTTVQQLRVKTTEPWGHQLVIWASFISSHWYSVFEWCKNTYCGTAQYWLINIQNLFVCSSKL